ncbi:hypothetical protein SE17_22690 [Kouleothrix aurantiaca]|uniref:HTH cro/C1-type domain-containing protein n=1 Tax=Kouleothrix aurantiaca TaxID=186479 RepID=A0A0P9CZS3_9CHLR|nr:hypothetical protein SE17_22690 [Kouleothrix aurantiaca]
MADSATFRTWLKRRRVERGLTQDELGELVAYAGQTIRKIESGQRRTAHRPRAARRAGCWGRAGARFASAERPRQAAQLRREVSGCCG